MADLIPITRTVAILFFLILAVTSDIKTRKIPNSLSMPFVLVGLGFNTAFNFPDGLKVGVLGLLVGFLSFIIPYVMNTMGAGDVKLMVALGAITDWQTILYIAIFTALSGGVIVVLKKVASRGVIRMVKRTGSLVVFYLFSLLEKNNICSNNRAKER